MLDELRVHNNQDVLSCPFFLGLVYLSACNVRFQLYYICRNASIGFSVFFHSSSNKSIIAE